MRLFISLLLMALLQVSCANSGTGQAPPKTVGKVDLERFQGTWHLLAALPWAPEQGCLENRVSFTLRRDRGLDVVNHCRGRRAVWTEFQGAVEPQEKGSTDKFVGNFNGGLLSALGRERYWILAVEDDYQAAMIGDPNLSRLWLFGRSPEIKQATLDKMLLAARKRGYDVKRLVWRRQNR